MSLTDQPLSQLIYPPYSFNTPPNPFKTLLPSAQTAGGDGAIGGGASYYLGPPTPAPDAQPSGGSFGEQYPWLWMLLPIGLIFCIGATVTWFQNRALRRRHAERVAELAALRRQRLALLGGLPDRMSAEEQGDGERDVEAEAGVGAEASRHQGVQGQQERQGAARPPFDWTSFILQQQQQMAEEQRRREEGLNTYDDPPPPYEKELPSYPPLAVLAPQRGFVAEEVTGTPGPPPYNASPRPSSPSGSAQPVRVPPPVDHGRHQQAASASSQGHDDHHNEWPRVTERHSPSPESNIDNDPVRISPARNLRRSHSQTDLRGSSSICERQQDVGAAQPRRDSAKELSDSTNEWEEMIRTTNKSSSRRNSNSFGSVYSLDWLRTGEDAGDSSGQGKDTDRNKDEKGQSYS